MTLGTNALDKFPFNFGFNHVQPGFGRESTNPFDSASNFFTPAELGIDLDMDMESLAIALRDSAAPGQSFYDPAMYSTCMSFSFIIIMLVVY